MSVSDAGAELQRRAEALAARGRREEPPSPAPVAPRDTREHPLAGCRRRHTKGEDCLLGCSCPCHEKWVDLGEPCRTAEQLGAAIMRGREKAVAELASMPPDDGTVSVSTLDLRTYVRDGFKLCLTCHWRRGPGGRCAC